MISNENQPQTTSSNQDLLSQALAKIKYGEDLLTLTKAFEHIRGIQKLQRKLQQEIKFLTKVKNKDILKKEHLQCSNLTHFGAVLNTLHTVEKCTHISKVYMLSERKITVDIVCNDGLTWMKVVARNPKSLSLISMGNAGYGVRSILDQADEYVQCAKMYPCLFQTPKIIFVFASGIGYSLARKLELYGITVQGERIMDSEVTGDFGDEDDEEEESCNNKEDTARECPIAAELTTKNISHITRVNLDVSAMLVYCSSVTNGSASLYEFSVPVLAQQAKWEAERPQKPILEEFFKGKQLYCCQTAMNSFESIVNIVGGPNEKKRAEELMKIVTVLPDDAVAQDTTGQDDDSDIFNNIQFTSDKTLQVGGKIRERSLKVFTFGDRIRAVTVTANDGFVRAAKQQGINFVVFLHESRALTEQKEQTRGKVKLKDETR